MKADHRFIACAAALSLMACGGGTELTATLSGAAERPKEFFTALSGAAEKPNAVSTPASGSVTVVRDGGGLKVTGTFRDLLANATAAHIHGPADENSTSLVFCNLIVPAATSGTIAQSSGAGSCGNATLTDANVADLENGKLYVNIHTSVNPSGEIRGQLRPRTPSVGTGTVEVTVDGSKLQVSGSFSELEGNALAAHIHGPADAESAGPVFCTLLVPSAPSGTIGAGEGGDSCGAKTLSDTDVENFKNGRMYINIHTELRPNGAIRGQLEVPK